MKGALALTPALALVGCVTPRSGPTLRGFEQALRAQDSATAALGQWCARYHIADPARIVAVPAGGPQPGNLAAIRAALEVGPNEKIGFRHVLLECGNTVLSDAYNWFVPGRLTPRMNHILETTHTPFGKVVAPLEFRRERLTSEQGAATACPANTILSHRAVLRLPSGKPISLVSECYTPAALGR